MMKKRLLVLLLFLCAAAGTAGSHAFARIPAPLRLPVVMYHHISREPSRWNDYVISEKEFESDLRWLRDAGYETVSIAELLAWENGEFTMPEKPCMITFDDGFESTLAYAEPLLREYGFRGVVAVIGSVCEKFSALDEHDPELSNMSWEEASAMAARGVIEVQCHTWDMHALWPRKGCMKTSRESLGTYRAALSRDLSRFLTAAAAHGVDLAPAIAYPYGAYSRETADAVRDFGFLVAFTCSERVNCLSGAEGELLELGRFNRPHGPGSKSFFQKWEEND